MENITSSGFLKLSIAGNELYLLRNKVKAQMCDSRVTNWIEMVKDSGGGMLRKFAKILERYFDGISGVKVRFSWMNPKVYGIDRESRMDG